MSTYDDFLTLVEQRLIAQVEIMLDDIKIFKDRLSNDAPLFDTLQNLLGFSQDFQKFVIQTKRLTMKNRLEIFDLYNRILEKIGREWSSIRLMVIQKIGLGTTNRYTSFFDQAGRFANGCLRLKNDGANVNFDVYFQSTFHISSLDYARTVPIIALPVDVWRDPWLWMGIVHEVGHYIYWNYQLNGQPLQNQLQQMLREKLTIFANNKKLLETWCVRWVEEIFADLYGAVILGPAYIESLMAHLAALCSADMLYETDDEHPATILRPLLQIALLRKLPDLNINAALDELESVWMQYGAELTGKPQDKLLERTVDGLSKDDLEEAIHITTTTVFDLLCASIDLTKLQAYSDTLHRTILDKAEVNFNDVNPLKREHKLAIGWYAWKKKSRDIEHLHRTRIAMLNTGTEFQKFPIAQADPRPAEQRSFMENVLKEALVDVEVEPAQKTRYELEKMIISKFAVQLLGNPITEKNIESLYQKTFQTPEIQGELARLNTVSLADIVGSTKARILNILNLLLADEFSVIRGLLPTSKCDLCRDSVIVHSIQSLQGSKCNRCLRRRTVVAKAIVTG